MVECYWEQDEGGKHYIAWVDELGTHVEVVDNFDDAISIILSNECYNIRKVKAMEFIKPGVYMEEVDISELADEEKKTLNEMYFLKKKNPEFMESVDKLIAQLYMFEFYEWLQDWGKE